PDFEVSEDLTAYAFHRQLFFISEIMCPEFMRFIELTHPDILGHLEWW
ncbi:unnamed protein product, partial [marine sediment metagenome]